MRDVFAFYIHGDDGFEHDEKIRFIMEKRGGRAVGAGTSMPTGERDVQYRFEDSEIAEITAVELRAHGFRVETRTPWQSTE